MTPHQAFVSYNSVDRELVHRVANELVESGVTCWLDDWSLVPGTPWQEEAEQALSRADVVLVIIGPSGFGGWHTEELRVAIDLRISSRDTLRVAPVILPGVSKEIMAAIPLFLKRMTWVDLRKTSAEERRIILRAAVEGRPTSAPLKSSRGPLTPRLSKSDRLVLKGATTAVVGSVRWAQQSQNLDGGLPSDNAGTFSCTWASAGLLWAVQAAAIEDPSNDWLRRGVTWVLDNANTDGGIPIVTRGDPSIVDASAQALLASAPLAIATNSDRLARGANSLTDWLVDHQQASGAWPWALGTNESWTASTAFALMALVTMERTGRAERDVRRSISLAVEWLRRTRNNDGGWGSGAKQPSQPSITGLAMYCLSQSGESLVEDDSLRFLLSTQTLNGEWSSTIERPGGRTVIRFGLPYGLLGLSTCVGGEEVLPQLRRSVKRLLNANFDADHFRYADSNMHTWPTRDCLLALNAVIERYTEAV